MPVSQHTHQRSAPEVQTLGYLTTVQTYKWNQKPGRLLALAGNLLQTCSTP